MQRIEPTQKLEFRDEPRTLEPIIKRSLYFSTRIQELFTLRSYECGIDAINLKLITHQHIMILIIQLVSVT